MFSKRHTVSDWVLRGINVGVIKKTANGGESTLAVFGELLVRVLLLECFQQFITALWSDHRPVFTLNSTFQCPQKLETQVIAV